MSFNTYLSQLLDDFRIAWNKESLDDFAEMITDDFRLTTPGLIFTNVSIKPHIIIGKEEAMAFFKQSRKKVPLRSTISDIEIGPTKKVKFKVHYYEIDLWSAYECIINKYGKFEELNIARIEDPDGKKISTMLVLKNVLKHKVKSLLIK